MAPFETTNSATAAPATGRIKFHKSEIDFGNVKRGETLDARFTFVNRGKGPLWIKGIHASCGCIITAMEEGRKYQPGEEGYIEIQFKTEGFSGRVSKTITVATNDRSRPDRLVRIRAKISSEFTINPPVADLAKLAESPSRELILNVTPKDRFALKVTGAEYDEKRLTVAIEETKSAWRVRVKSVDKRTDQDLPQQRMGAIYLLTNSKHLPRSKIPLVGELPGEMRIVPSYLEFGALKTGNAVEKTIVVEGHPDVASLTVTTEVHLNGKRLNQPSEFVSVQKPKPATVSSSPQAAAAPIRSSSTNQLRISLRNTSKATGSVHGRLKISGKSGSPAAEFRFYAFFR